jgi:ribosomal-protein-alanine N-acetyltransferase
MQNSAENKILRPIEKADIDEIVKLEQASFSAPFTKSMFEALIGQKPFEGFVLEINGKLAGYIIFSLVIDVMELLTIAVQKELRKKGLAKGLLERMIARGRETGVKSIYLEVRPSNAIARGLYKGFGFKELSIRKGYYKDNNEDAIVMELSMAHSKTKHINQ